MARAYDLPEDPGMNLEFDFRTWTPGEPARVGPFTIQPIHVEHPVDAFGLRVSAGGALLAFTGDSGRCEQLEAVARGADLLLAEASFHDDAANPPGIHLTGSDCGRLARDGRVSRLVITHVPPWYEPKDMLAAAQRVWDGPSELAKPGAVYDL
jgi:ribonuclease BN (tRNA processing enzyme)